MDNNNLNITIETLTHQRHVLDTVIQMLQGQNSVRMVSIETSRPLSPTKTKDMPRRRPGRKPTIKPGFSIRELATTILKQYHGGLSTRELVEHMGKHGKSVNKSTMTTVAQTLRRHRDEFGKRKGKWILVPGSASQGAVSVKTNKP